MFLSIGINKSQNHRGYSLHSDVCFGVKLSIVDAPENARLDQVPGGGNTSI